MSNQLQQAIAAIQGGDLDRGRQLLARVLLEDPQSESAWLWMSATVDDDQQRRECLEKIIEINPDNQTARKGLEVLNARLGPPEEQPIPDFFSPGEEAPAHSEPAVFDWERVQPEAGQVTSFFDQPGEATSGLEGEQPAAFSWETQPEEGSEDLMSFFAEGEQAPQAASGSETEFSWLLEPQGEPEAAPGVPDETPIFEEPANKPLYAFEPEPEPSAAPAAWGSTTYLDDTAPNEAAASEVFEPIPPAQEELPDLPRLWVNPRGAANRLTMLTDKSIVLANPDPKKLMEIKEQATQGQVARELLGRGAQAIKLENLLKVTATQQGEDMRLLYRAGKEVLTHSLTFTNAKDCEDALTALQRRLGNQFQRSMRSNSLLGQVLLPGLVLAILATFTGLAFFGALLIQDNPSLLASTPLAGYEGLIRSLLAMAGPWGVLLIGGALSLAAFIWLILSLRKPATSIILSRKS